MSGCAHQQPVTMNPATPEPEKCTVQAAAKASVSKYISYHPPARGANRLFPSASISCMLGMCKSPTLSCCPGFVSSLGHLWRLNILFCKVRFSVPNSCGKEPFSAPLCFSTVALFLTGFNHPIIKSDTALTPYHCNLINFWSHKSFLYIKYVVSMGWISYLLHRDTQQHQLCANAVEKENKAAPEEDIEGLSSFPPANLKTPADGQQRLNCL